MSKPEEPTTGEIAKDATIGCGILAIVAGVAWAILAFLIRKIGG